MAEPVTVHKCECHGADYQVCPVCRCQYCPRYWRTCPRCAPVLHVARAIEERDFQ
jgi:hypothetical protein